MSPTCDVCGEPIQPDESYGKDAHGTRHVRCTSGVARPRPEHMEDLCPCGKPVSRCNCWHGDVVRDEE